MTLLKETFYGTRNQKGNQQFYVGEDEQKCSSPHAFKQVDNNEIDIDHTGVADESRSRKTIS